MTLLGEITPLVEPLEHRRGLPRCRGRASSCSARPGRSARGSASGCSSETGLHCSVGAAATKFVAKLASGRAKPDGLLVVPAASTIAFLHPQPVTALWGVGGKTRGAAAAPRAAHDRRRRRGPARHARRARSGPATPTRLHELAWGRDPRADRARAATRRASATRPPSRPTSRIPSSCTASCCGSRMRVGARLRRAGVQARTVALKLRFADFTTISRSRTLAEPTDLGRRIYEEARSLYDAAIAGRPPGAADRGARRAADRRRRRASGSGTTTSSGARSRGTVDADRLERSAPASVRPATLLGEAHAAAASARRQTT